MYLLIFLTVLATVAGVPINNDDQIAKTNRDLAAQYLLPGESIPTFYDVRLFIDPGNVEYFYGNVSIRIIPTRSTSEIVLQAMELTIDDIEVYSERSADIDVNIYKNYTLATDDTHFLRIEVNGVLNVAQPYVVHIHYVGKYAENMFGVYVSSYELAGVTVNLVTSQLQPTFARRAFPCYDEPGIKAIFRTTIYAPREYPVVLSNMPERNDTLKEDVPGYVKHEFQDTLKMSTYLIAYLVSNFSHIGNEAEPIYNKPFKVFSRIGTQETAEFALEFGQQNLKALENYTELEYAFPKMDKVAVPDFAAGAMENWGLVIYREVALLVRDGVTTTATKQNIGRIITHENTHQWFGNEVSPFTWTHTWLNEGFATFFEMYATDLVLPGWRMMDQFVLNMQNVFQSDAVLGVNPMTHEVFTPSQVLSTFNAVAYQKSGSVIRMLEHILTPEVFRKGLVIYLKNNVQSAVLPSHLYAALQQALDESNFTIPYTVSAIMQRWTTQGGFPVLNVRRSAPGAESISISQERFLTDRSLSSNDRWHVPVNWVLSTDVDFSDTSPQAWVPPTGPAVAIDIPGLSEIEWFIVNKQQTGYYRVNYEPENWNALIQMMNVSHENIHVLNRAQLIDDAFNLARNGRLPYVHALQLSLYLIKETDYVPWASANAAINYLDIVLSGSPVYSFFRYYTLNLTAPLFESLGFEASANEEHVTPYHRNIILDINCRHGNERCVSQAEEMLQNSETQPLNPDIQTTVYCSALRGGNPDYFQLLWDKYLASTDSSEQSILLNALGCTSDEDSRTRYLNEVIDDESPVREQDKHTIVVSVINSSPENMEAALEFILEHFDKIQPRVQGLTGTTNILNALSRRLTTQEHLKKIEEFETLYSFTPGELASISSIKENIGASITWSKENLVLIDDWLRTRFGNNANILTSSLLIIVSVIVTIYNY